MLVYGLALVPYATTRSLSFKSSAALGPMLSDVQRNTELPPLTLRGCTINRPLNVAFTVRPPTLTDRTMSDPAPTLAKSPLPLTAPVKVAVVLAVSTVPPPVLTVTARFIEKDG